MKKLLTVFALTACFVMVAVYSTAQAGPPAKVTVCHVDPDYCEGVEEPCLLEPNPHVIRISERALEAHLAHGDYETPNLTKGDSCDLPVG